MEFTPEQKQTAIIAGAAAAGVAQTLILKNYMDNTKSMHTSLSMLGAFSYPAPLIGIVGGSLAIVLSLFVLKEHAYRHAITAYGGAALVSGIAAGIELTPKTVTPAIKA